jgi:hypothetical protein
MTRDLRRITPAGTGRPKGLVPYRPKGKTTTTIERIRTLYAEMHDADALPLGPRQVGYRLKERHPGEYDKSNFKAIEENVKRLQQASKIPWGWVADSSALTYESEGWSDPATFLRKVHESYERDRLDGQSTVIEICAEARETLPLIRRLGAERGVTVYSGGGSAGPNLAHKVARRALRRAVEHGQSTLILGIADFDLPGIRNILRPHIEHVSAFLYGTADNAKVIAQQKGEDGPLVSMAETGHSVMFDQIALTPRQALGLAETEVDRREIFLYATSGIDMWDRDLDLLDGVQKIETEALDPVDLRRLVIDAIEDVLDLSTLNRIGGEEAAERADLERRLGEVADDL